MNRASLSRHAGLRDKACRPSRMQFHAAPTGREEAGKAIERAWLAAGHASDDGRQQQARQAAAGGNDRRSSRRGKQQQAVRGSLASTAAASARVMGCAELLSSQVQARRRTGAACGRGGGQAVGSCAQGKASHCCDRSGRHDHTPSAPPPWPAQPPHLGRRGSARPAGAASCAAPRPPAPRWPAAAPGSWAQSRCRAALRPSDPCCCCAWMPCCCCRACCRMHRGRRPQLSGRPGRGAATTGPLPVPPS